MLSFTLPFFMFPIYNTLSLPASIMMNSELKNWAIWRLDGIVIPLAFMIHFYHVIFSHEIEIKMICQAFHFIPCFEWIHGSFPFDMAFFLLNCMVHLPFFACKYIYIKLFLCDLHGSFHL